MFKNALNKCYNLTSLSKIHINLISVLVWSLYVAINITNILKFLIIFISFKNLF
jgi:hypothetical protein